MKFAPLNIVTRYSFLQSGLTEERIIHALKENNYFGMAIADNEVMFGIPPFVKEMEKVNKPYLIGETFVIEDDYLSLFVISEEGYKNLIALNSLAITGLSLENINEHKDGLVAILHTVRGRFNELFVQEIDQSFNKYLLNLSKPFGDNFYLGLEVTSKEGVAYANKIRKFANEYSYQTIAFPRVRYEKKDDAIIILMTDAIRDNQKINAKKAVGQDYFMKEEDYSKIYSSKEMENTIKIIKQSTFNFSNKRGELLHYDVSDSKEELQRLCFEALKEKNINDERHIERLNYELKTIFEMGYADYFLIVQDYVKYAKNHDILVGPGRGSAAGSLVSYLLDITEINPLDYDLQFERFLNPYRKTMPDIDVDFMDIRRDDMVQYMRDKYGSSRVGNIVTFQTIGAKQALRDVGMIYNYPSHHIDLLSKRITEKDYSLRDAYKILPDFRSLVDSDKYFLEIVTLASKIEGLIRQSGLHAAGIVLDEKPLDESVPVSILLNNYISQYEMQYLEEQGLLKMDFLSLSNLTIIYNCVNLINARHNLSLKADQIPYNGKEIFDLISSGKTLGLFQIETVPMRRAIKVLKPSSFDDVVALLALCRPGPMKYIPTYAKRKAGKEQVTFLSEDIKDILSSTYGIIVYQEQINSIATRFAGFSLGEADVFRRAISKKDKDVILSYEKKFIEGAIKANHTKEVAKKVFEDILRFAEYGFNKSHSVVYSIIACRMAWLKAHYPAEFYSALMGSSSATSDSKFSEYIVEMNSLGIKMLPPSINNSGSDFVIRDNALLFPLTGIKEINYGIYQQIDEERKANGGFKDFFNFVLRMFSRKINEKQITALIDSGAFDEFFPSRASMRQNLLSAIQYAEVNQREDGQLSIGIEPVAPPIMRESKDDPIVNLDRENQVLGIMLSDSPLSYHREELNKLGVISINDAKEKNSALVAGIIKMIKTITTKKGESMSFVKIFDETDEMEITIFPKTLKENAKLVKKNNIVIIQIKMRESRDETSYIADEIKSLEKEEKE